MQEILAALLLLQEIDTQIFRTQGELKRLPAERAARRTEIEKRTTKLAETKNEAMKLRVRIKEIEDQTTVQRQRMRKVENEAATSRQDMALLVAYQHEIRTLKHNISDNEEQGLELLEKAEVIDKDAAVLAADIEREQKVYEELSSNVEKELALAHKRLDDLHASRKQRLSGSIPPEAFSIYTRLITAREGVALAELDGRMCQACFMEVPTNVVVRVTRGIELVQCPGCSRIFYQRR